MRTLTRFLVIGSLAALLSGCLSSEVPDLGLRTQNMNTVGARVLPADLMSCDDFYGEDWDTPDKLLRVDGQPEVVVLVQAGEMVCSGTMNQLESRLVDIDLGTMLPLNGKNETEGQGGNSVTGESLINNKSDSNPLPAAPAGNSAHDIPVGDSNPLPANPGSDTGADLPTGDSNPLPAAPAGDNSDDVSDSNPLPARDASTANAEFHAFFGE